MQSVRRQNVYRERLSKFNFGTNGLVMTAHSNPLPDKFRQGGYQSLDRALISLCDRAEALAVGSIAGLTICNPSRTHLERAIFPRLPQYAAAITAIPLSPSDFGRCVQAVACGEIITCPDITKEQRFDPRWRRLNLDNGLRSLQSRPVYLRDRTPYGTFVLAYREPRKETDWDVALMKFAADAAGLIIQSDLDRRDIAAEPSKADTLSA